MATYLYACECGHQREERHGMNEYPDVVCYLCKKNMSKKITSEYSGMSRKTGDDNMTSWEETKFRNT